MDPKKELEDLKTGPRVEKRDLEYVLKINIGIIYYLVFVLDLIV